jgi:hypothetical protein
MHGLHVTLVGVRGGRDAHVLTVPEGGGEAGAGPGRVVSADELSSVVGLPDQVAERDAVAVQMALDARGEDFAGRRAAALGEGQEEQPAADVAGGVLHGRESQRLRLGPEPRNIAEILGVGTDLLEEPPGGFDRGQILLALIFPPAFGQEPMGAPDALEGAMAEGQVELADQAASAEGGQGVAQLDDATLDLRRGLVRLVMRGTRTLHQARGALLLVATQPLAHGGHSGSEEPGGGFDAASSGGLDQAQAMVVSVFHFTNQIEVGGGHGGQILPAARRPALPPAGRPAPAASSHSCTAASPGGYDVSRLSHSPFSFDSEGVFPYTQRFVRGVLALLVKGKVSQPRNTERRNGVRRAAGMGRQPRKAE